MLWAWMWVEKVSPTLFMDLTDAQKEIQLASELLYRKYLEYYGWYLVDLNPMWWNHKDYIHTVGELTVTRNFTTQGAMKCQSKKNAAMV